MLILCSKPLNALGSVVTLVKLPAKFPYTKVIRGMQAPAVISASSETSIMAMSFRLENRNKEKYPI